MTDDKQFTRGAADGASPDGTLTPAEALDLAERARAAAGRPAPMPWWYGPGVGATLAVYLTALGQSFQQQAPWLIPLCVAAMAVAMGAIVRVGMRASGVARHIGGKVPPELLRAFVLVVLAAALAWLGGRLATGGQEWAMAAAGVVGGLGVWGVITRANRQVKEQIMSSAR